MKIKSVSFLMLKTGNDCLTSENIEKFSKKVYSFTWRFWGIWVFTLILILAIFLAVMDVAPYLHKDEVIIVDLGRIILNQHAEWSINWLIDQNQPAFLFTYVGPVLQELAYEFGGQFGPRVSGLLGGLSAATALVGWLLTRGIKQKVAFGLGLIFLLDPLFVQAITLGRLDGWTIALCLSCCWIISYIYHSTESRLFNVHLLIAGGLASMAFFIWPSAVFLFPLIALELFGLVSKNRINGETTVGSIRPVLLFIIGFSAATLLFLISISPQIFTQINNILESVKSNTRSGSSGGQLLIFQNAIELLRVLKYTPVLVIFSLAGIAMYRQTGLVLMLLVTIIMTLGTVVYIHRVLYLVPYFIGCVSGIYQNKSSNFSPQLVRLVGIGLLLMWSVSLSLGTRTFIALNAKVDQNRDLVQEASLSLLGPGNKKVLAPFEFYYPGRAIGWEMYNLYLALNEPVNLTKTLRILPHVDYIIMSKPHLVDEHEWVNQTKEFENILLKKGWQDKGIFHLYNKPAEPFNGVINNNLRIRNLFSVFRKPYGPYRLFVRGKGNLTI